MSAHKYISASNYHRSSLDFLVGTMLPVNMRGVYHIYTCVWGQYIQYPVKIISNKTRSSHELSLENVCIGSSPTPVNNDKYYSLRRW